jgi:hypothetical protein
MPAARPSRNAVTHLVFRGVARSGHASVQGISNQGRAALAGVCRLMRGDRHHGRGEVCPRPQGRPLPVLRFSPLPGEVCRWRPSSTSAPASASPSSVEEPAASVTGPGPRRLPAAGWHGSRRRGRLRFPWERLRAVNAPLATVGSSPDACGMVQSALGVCRGVRGGGGLVCGRRGRLRGR